MKSRWMKATLVLIIVLISLISISLAAGPRAVPDQYIAKCGVELSISAPGLLRNDVPSGSPLHVSSWTAPTLGTLKNVDPNGSFTYVPPQSSLSSVYAYFYYTAVDGNGVLTNQAQVKISIACKGGCTNPCKITSVPFTVCSGITPAAALIMAQGAITCSCDTSPVISNIHIVDNHWEYTITCQSTCGAATATGRVNIEAPCTITPDNSFTVCSGVTPTAAEIQSHITCSCGNPIVTNIVKNLAGTAWTYDVSCTSANGCLTTATGIVNIQTPCVPTSKPFTICSGVTPTTALILANGAITCGTGVCDTTPAISGIHAVDGHWEYTITCTTALGCSATATGIVNIQTPCVPTSKPFTICSGVTPTTALILANGAITCGTGVCDTTPAISGIHAVDGHWEYTITCTTAIGCSATATGIVNIQTPCVPTSKPFTICSGVTPTTALILANGAITCGTGVCDTTPAISGIHAVDGHWEYTITCTTALGCSATATGIVNIQTPCVPTSKPFTICSGVTPTTALILANGAITCGTGVCDTTPAISGIHAVDGHWEYTITCTTALGCSATATGIVNIQTPCVPTSKAFTICSGVTPTTALILANGAITCGTGVCDTTPAISGIHEVDGHWEYTITCTSVLGCTATGTGIVNIGQPCEITFFAFPIPTIDCPGNQLPTIEQIMDLGGVTCSCDPTPAISDIHWVSTPSDGEWTGEYTITCTSADGCTSTETGQFNNLDCERCDCDAPTFKPFTICSGVTPTTALILANGAVTCGTGECDATPDISDIHTVGNHWEYNITCTTASGCSATATGIVNIQTPCAPTSTPFTICSGVTPTTALILANGAVTCGTGECDTTPAISGIHLVGNHWEYTITCTTVLGCSATATGIVNIQTPCVPTSTPFTICSGVTPTTALILANGAVTCGTGECDTTPAISGIHLVGNHWEYTITCTTVLGCSATATGIVNIQTPCVPTSTPFTICSGVTPTSALILANGAVTCGTGECDTTPVISGIHLVGNHWEYTITCTTASGCSATATGIVNIQTPCVPTSEAFTICKGVTPTAKMILASGSVDCGTGDCDAEPAISGIHLVGNHWEYTITCQSTCGPATATGIVNIGSPCEISFMVFSLPPESCPGNILPTAAQIIDLGVVYCGCDATPVISNIHWVSKPAGGEWTGEYTITCTTKDGCTSTTTGQFNNPDCSSCSCAPTAPNLCGCTGSPFPMDLFTSKGGGCHPASGCDVTPTAVIDESKIQYNIPGHSYPYTVTCPKCSGNNVATGYIFIRSPICGPTPNGGFSCTCPVDCPPS